MGTTQLTCHREDGLLPHLHAGNKTTIIRSLTPVPGSSEQTMLLLLLLTVGAKSSSWHILLVQLLKKQRMHLGAEVVNPGYALKLKPKEILGKQSTGTAGTNRVWTAMEKKKDHHCGAGENQKISSGCADISCQAKEAGLVS